MHKFFSPATVPPNKDGLFHGSFFSRGWGVSDSSPHQTSRTNTKLSNKF